MGYYGWGVCSVCGCLKPLAKDESMAIHGITTGTVDNECSGSRRPPKIRVK